MRASAKRLGHRGKFLCGAVSFVQQFSSTLALQPHLHLLVPEGLFSGGGFLELPRPTQEQLEAVLARTLAQAKRTFEALDAPWPEDEYQTKRDVTLVLTAEQLVRRLLWLVPPARFHLTSFHGVLSSHAAARATLLPTPAQSPAAPATGARAVKPAKPRLDWAALHARVWAVDVWQCPCGGRRKVTALVTSRRTAEEILRNLGLLPAPSPRPVALAQAPPQLELPMP